MIAVYPHQVDYGNTTNGGLRFSSHFVNHLRMSDSTEKPPFHEIGRRLTAIRTGESDLSQKEWAIKHGFGISTYNNWETGIRRIKLDDAERLCDRYGLKLDFIYRGNIQGLPESIKKRL